MSLRICLIIAVVFVCPYISKPQDQKLGDLKMYEDTLMKLQKIIYSNDAYTSRESKCNIYINLLKDALEIKGSFQYPFDSLKHLGKISSSDGKVRIYTLNLPLSDGTQKYYGFIQHQVNKKNNQLFILKDSRDKIQDQINETLSQEKWYGSLYYSIIYTRIEGDDFYILLGVDFNNLFSSRKIIEVLSFDESGEPTFGTPIFKVAQNTLSRVVFEYSAKATMTLRYIDKEQMIVFDHLSPSRPDFAGNYQFYGPDFTYDGFKFDKSQWVYVQDLDLRNPNRERKQLVNTPEKLPEPGFLYKSKYKY